MYVRRAAPAVGDALLVVTGGQSQKKRKQCRKNGRIRYPFHGLEQLKNHSGGGNAKLDLPIAAFEFHEVVFKVRSLDIFQIVDLERPPTATRREPS